jgi:hypothetical protein
MFPTPMKPTFIAVSPTYIAPAAWRTLPDGGSACLVAPHASALACTNNQPG